VRERWFGATGRRVPAIALEGTVDVGEALVVDSLEDLDELRLAHALGQPVVTRAGDADAVARALARPEISCVLVQDPTLLELDFPELTYG
jgi:hypothetical protein